MDTNPIDESQLFPIPAALLGIPLFAPHSTVVFHSLQAAEQHATDRASYLANVSFNRILIAQANDDFKRALTATDYLFPIGIPARLASLTVGLGFLKRESVWTISKKLLDRLETSQKSVFIIGQLPPGAETVNTRLSERRPKLKTVGEYWIPSDAWSPKEGYQLNKVLQEARPDVLLFSSSHVQARIWMIENAPALAKVLVYDLGASTSLFARLLGFKRERRRFAWWATLRHLFRETARFDRAYLKKLSSFLLRIMGERRTLKSCQVKTRAGATEASFKQHEKDGILYVSLPARFDTAYLIRHREDWARLAAASSGVILDASKVERFDSRSFGTLVHLSHQFQHRGYHLVIQDPSVGLVRFLQYSNTPGQLNTRYNPSAAEDLAKTPAWTSDQTFGTPGEPILWRGNITSQTADQVWDDTTAAIRRNEQRTQSFQIELSKVTLLDSTGIGMMIKLKKRFTKQGYRIAFVNPKPNVKKLLDMTQLADFLLKG